MDLSNLKPGERTVEIVHPGTGQALGIRVRIVSLDDDRMRKLRRAITDDALKLQQRNKAYKAEDIETNTHRILFEATRGWEWYNPTGSEGDEDYDPKAMPEFNGGVPEFNQLNFMAIVKTLPWFSTQLNEAVSETKDFFVNSAPS